AAGGGTPSAGGAAPVSSGSSGPRTSLAMQVWSKLVGALMMVFYAVRGIAMLVGQMFRRKPKPAPRPVVSPQPAVAATPAPVEAPAATQPEAAAPAAEVVAEQVSAADVYGGGDAAATEPSPAASKPVVVEARATAAQKKPAEESQASATESDEVNGAPAVQAGRGKGAGRRGIRLKLIQPGESDTGLK
ncbi:MAG: hypothetical protein MUF57_04320, partial [Gammaproteobacteria bacterium]|nr:hypothetical protein [Gammaproteobacteria bacterium]